MLKKTDEKINKLYVSLDKSQQEIMDTLIILLQELPYEVEGEWKWNAPNYTYQKKLFAYINTAKNHVTFGFHDGYRLDEYDEHHILQGSGKNLRYINITDAKMIPKNELLALATKAIEIR
ncbi:DUF1801 domain-containing protein [Breznakia pachnodae]|uniref:YdhG-like domain-containing protein n=1 Tax=Breznakia pachnodae TaxID=265178 RepID=A0ABU0E739_9FIRM|nr:DUF1801 domain-containing protein [Breznakia pachnodae]MDQ0362707.1 hypothetical protein [Breznakia pachnodae]